MLGRKEGERDLNCLPNRCILHNILQQDRNLFIKQTLNTQNLVFVLIHNKNGISILYLTIGYTIILLRRLDN